MTATICILFTESSPNMGGQEWQLLQQIGALKALGITVVLACRPGSRIEREARAKSFEVLCLPFRNSAHPPTIFRLRSWLRNRRPNACVCHSGHDTNNLAVAARLIGGRRPRLVRSRTYHPGRASSWTYNALVDLTVVPSEFLRNQILNANRRIDEARVAVLRPGIDFERIDIEAKQSLPPGLEHWLHETTAGPLTVQVGMLRGEKGHLLALDALAPSAARWPTLRHVIAGSGPEEAAIRARVESLGLQQRIWIGEVRPIAPLLARADLLLMPSLSEPLGMAQIEALGLGVPVLASDIGGIPETVAHERSGRLVSAGNASAWSEAVQQALESLPHLRRLAQWGRQDVRTRFGVPANTAELLRLLLPG